MLVRTHCRSYASGSFLSLILSVALYPGSLFSQEPQARDYLIYLETPDPGLGARLRTEGVKPLREAGKTWLVRMDPAREADVRSISGVKELKPAFPVIIKLEQASAAKTVVPRIENLGGLVTATYNHAPAIAAVLPATSIPALRKLPGVSRVSKQKVSVQTTTD